MSAERRRERAGRHDRRRKGGRAGRIDVAADPVGACKQCRQRIGIDARNAGALDRGGSRARQRGDQRLHRLAAGRQRRGDVAAAGQSAALQELAEIGAGELELRRDQRRAVVVLGLEQAGEFAAVEPAADVGQPDPVPGDDGQHVRVLENPEIARRDRAERQLQFAGERHCRLRLERHGRPVVPGRLQAGIAEHHGGDRRGVERIEAEIAGQMRLAILDFGIDVAGYRAVGDLALDVADDQQPACEIDIGRQRDRRAHAHAGEAHAGGHQPWFEIRGLDAGRTLCGHLAVGNLEVAVEIRLHVLAAEIERQLEPAGDRAFRRERRMAAARQAERQRRQPVERHQRARIRIVGRKGQFERRLLQCVESAVARNRQHEVAAAGRALGADRDAVAAVVIARHGSDQVDPGVPEQAVEGLRPLVEFREQRLSGYCAASWSMTGARSTATIEASTLPCGRPANSVILPVALIVAPASPPIDSRSISRSPPCSRSATSTVSAVRPLAETGPALSLMSRSRSAKRSPPVSLTNSEENAASPSTSSASPVSATRIDGFASFGSSFSISPRNLALPRMSSRSLNSWRSVVRSTLALNPAAGSRRIASSTSLDIQAANPGRLADRDQQRAGEAEIVFAGSEQAGPFERGASRQRRRQRLQLPAVRHRLGLQPDVANGRVAGHDRRQVDVDRAGDRWLRQVEQRCPHRRDAIPQRQPGRLLLGHHRLVEAHLRAGRSDREARVGIELDIGLAVGGVGIVLRPGLEAEFVEREALMVERELAADAPGRQLGLGFRGLSRLARRSPACRRAPRCGWCRHIRRLPR